MRPFSNMATSLKKSPHLAPAAIAIAICALALPACNGSASSFLAPGAAPQGSHVERHMTSSQTTYSFTTVDDPNSNANEVSAINQRSKIVGVYGGSSSSDSPQSYASEPVYTKFRNVNEPNTDGTVATTLTSNRIVAGYVIDPNGQSGTFGYVRVRALPPAYFQDNGEATEILGMNDSENGVGFFVNSPSNFKVPFELSVPQNAFTTLTPPGAVGDAAATGIDGKGNIAGWEVTSNGTAGWFYKGGTYYSFSYNGENTYALSLNWSDQVVGYYVDGNSIPHGFVLTGANNAGPEQIWQTIDDPNGTDGTVVTGINNHHDLCGYFYDEYGVQHGFVAVPQS